MIIEITAVSVPYEITLLSNGFFGSAVCFEVSVPYEITLLSNRRLGIKGVSSFQYLMKLHYSQTKESIFTMFDSFSTL